MYFICVKEFHKAYPEGNIETDYDVTENGNIVFRAKVTFKTRLKEGEKVEMLMGRPVVPNRVFTGHAFGKAGASKAFEKLETIAVGRALAFAGFLADGDIASAEEMQEYQKEMADRDTTQASKTAISEAKALLSDAEDLKTLKDAFESIPKEIRGAKEVVDYKNELKDKFTTKKPAKKATKKATKKVTKKTDEQAEKTGD